MSDQNRSRRWMLRTGLGMCALGATGHVAFAAESDAVVRKKLSLLLDVDYQGVPLGDLLREIGRASKVPIELDWEALKAEGIVPVDTVKIKLRRIPMATAVRLLVAQAEAAPGRVVCNIDQGTLRVEPARGGAGDLVANADPKSRVNRAVVRALGRPVAVGFDETPLAKAIDRFRQITRQNIFVCWRQVNAAGASPKSNVTVPKFRATVREALANTFAASNKDKAVKIDTTVEDGIIVIRSARVGD